jgi:hypothetical protein
MSTTNIDRIQKLQKGNGEGRKRFSIFYAWAFEKIESVINQAELKLFQKLMLL